MLEIQYIMRVTGVHYDGPVETFGIGRKERKKEQASKTSVCS